MSDETRSNWVTVIQTVGFPIVAALVLAWFAYQTIQWERDKMLPALEKNTTALESVNATLRHLDKQ